jgi:hypothetical protein
MDDTTTLKIDNGMVAIARQANISPIRIVCHA